MVCCCSIWTDTMTGTIMHCYSIKQINCFCCNLYECSAKLLILFWIVIIFFFFRTVFQYYFKIWLQPSYFRQAKKCPITRSLFNYICSFQWYMGPYSPPDWSQIMWTKYRIYVICVCLTSFLYKLFPCGDTAICFFLANAPVQTALLYNWRKFSCSHLETVPRTGPRRKLGNSRSARKFSHIVPTMSFDAGNSTF